MLKAPAPRVFFLAAYYIPWSHEIIRHAGLEALAIAVFVSQASVIKYFGAQANKLLSYSVASASGTILAVCSCTVLPLFAGIYSRGTWQGAGIWFRKGAGVVIGLLGVYFVFGPFTGPA